MNDTEHTLHLIGDVARRTGLSVSAIRYYSDEGLVSPTDDTDGGHRLYDLDAIARFEFIRTLRDLDTGLEQIRRALTGVVSLRDLLAEHLDVVESRAKELQAKRAVLRALVRKESTSERAKLLQRLVTMSDGERQRLVDEFLESVSSDLPDAAVEKIREAHPRLPEDPSPEQLDAWISLSELLRDENFREEMRVYLRETYATEAGRRMSAPAVQEFISSAGGDLMPKLGAARAAGLASDDPRVVLLADQLVQQSATAGGVARDDDLRKRLADVYSRVDSITSEALQHKGYRATEGRYLELVAIINDQPAPDAELARAAGHADADQEPDLGRFGRWLSEAILATIG
ncbi:MerR family transcriptional regulator [Microbacterium sp. AK031]|uniref:helix-turn-helix domain-containing protein n=1 Tax=Microbacterium sp. AK031 TaxID=2723076 RepID=UPI0021681FFB|nr:MerR family transcriptional regulator [Microbacterium sp. AK031]MCS3843106.1 DNA-binding transcriptional MerR regulator [Microbacterium sp. AK031]